MERLAALGADNEDDGLDSRPRAAQPAPASSERRSPGRGSGRSRGCRRVVPRSGAWCCTTRCLSVKSSGRIWLAMLTMHVSMAAASSPGGGGAVEGRKAAAAFGAASLVHSVGGCILRLHRDGCRWQRGLVGLRLAGLHNRGFPENHRTKDFSLTPLFFGS